VIAVFFGPALRVTTTATYAAQEFYGVIESRLQEKAGQWIVGGRTVNMSDQIALI